LPEKYTGKNRIYEILKNMVEWSTIFYYLVSSKPTVNIGYEV
jgi:hypothetical protein